MSKANLAVQVEEERRVERICADVAAGIRVASGRRLPALIRNVSLDGFMAECGSTAVAPGTTVTLDLFDGSSFEARIVWKRDGHVGAAFATPISEKVLQAIC